MQDTKLAPTEYRSLNALRPHLAEELQMRTGRRADDSLIRGIRYADDAVFIIKPGADTTRLRKDIDKFLESRGLRINEAKTKVSKATDGFDFLGWRFRVNSRRVFKSTPSAENSANIKAKVKATWKNGATTEARLKMIESQVRGWRNHNRYNE